MRYLSMIRGAEQQGKAPDAFMNAMGTLIADMLADGTLVQTGGLAYSPAAVRVRSSAGKISITDGPFTESKELVGGYAIIEVPTRDAAIESTRRFMQLHADHWPGWTGECELREITFIAP